MMKRMGWIFTALAVLSFVLPAQAAENKKAAAESKKAAPVAEAKTVTPPPPSKEELVQRSLTGIQNQTAWIATLQKQLDGEKAKLDQMEADHAKAYGSSAKKTAAKAAKEVVAEAQS